MAIAIDDNEVSRLGTILDEIFGEEKKVAIAPWKSDPSGGKQKSGLRVGHEYILIYHNTEKSRLAQKEEELGEHKYNDKKGSYFKGRELLKWGAGSLKTDRETMWYPLQTPDGLEAYPYRNDGKKGRWRLGTINTYMRSILADPEEAHWKKRPFDQGVIVHGATERWVPYEKIRESTKSSTPSSWLDCKGTNADGTEEIKELFGAKVFDTPKPSSLYEWLISLCPNDDEL